MRGNTLAEGSAAPPAVAAESDFSPRKLRIASAIILGTLFGSTVLPMMALGLLLLPMTGEFGWSRTSFSLGMSAMMLGGSVSAPVLGALVDRLGVRPMIIGTVLVGLMTMALSQQSGALWQFLAASRCLARSALLQSVMRRCSGRCSAGTAARRWRSSASSPAWPAPPPCRSSSGCW